MIKVTFYNLDKICNGLKYSVIAAQYRDSWIVVRNKKRQTWEIPGGHIEDFETADEAAARELFEETGAREFNITPVSIYSVTRQGGAESFGKLFYAGIEEIADLPESEISEIRLVEKLPEKLTYPVIQPILFEKVREFIGDGQN